MRRFLSELIDLVWNGKINPSKVFDLTLLMEQPEIVDTKLFPIKIGE